MVLGVGGGDNILWGHVCTLYVSILYIAEWSFWTHLKSYLNICVKCPYRALECLSRQPVSNQAKPSEVGDRFWYLACIKLMVQVQKASWLMRYLNVQYLMPYNKPPTNSEKVSHVRYRTVCVNYLTNCIRELPVLGIWQIHFSTWRFYWLCFAISFLFLFFQMGFVIYILTLWPFKSLVPAVARALFSLNAYCRIVLSLSDVQGTHNGTTLSHFSDKG
jgi:hypothetical protein